MRILIHTLMAVTIASCTQPKSTEPKGAPPKEPASTPKAAASSPWEGKLGQVITVEGTAENAKLGALLSTDGSMTIWIDGLHSWPEGVRGKNVQVTGKVIQRSDLPVFVPQEGEPQMAGMPVPPGTDLEKARRRLLLAEAKWKVLE
jgi:hypothetical protein